MVWITIATEDELSEHVAIRLATEAGFEISQCLRKNGNGYLRSRIENFCDLSAQMPVLLITDLDTVVCPPALLKTWLGRRQKSEHLLFRVAVREIESWMLADHEAIRRFLGDKVTKLPPSPDSLTDPKAELLKLAARAPRELRLDLVAERNSMASQGLGYNDRLSGFTDTLWNPALAAERSPSLARTRSRLKTLADQLG